MAESWINDKILLVASKSISAGKPADWRVAE